MKNYYILLATSLILITIFSCGEKKSLETTRDISIGAALPLTGPIASYGKNSKTGIDLALSEINTELEFNIKVIYEDDAGEAKNAVSAIQKLISTDKVPLIIGEASSGYYNLPPRNIPAPPT